MWLLYANEDKVKRRDMSSRKMVEENFLEFYHIAPRENRLPIEQSPVPRQWMDDTSIGYAYRCLPMTYASRHGWCVRLDSDVEVMWGGDSAPDSTTIICGREQNGWRMADNGTGNGVVTFHLNAIPRTSPDWNLLIIGAPNLVIPGAAPLSGVVESDWMFSTPTMNWKITEVNKLVTFKKGDPVIFFFPIHKTMLETFKLKHLDLNDFPEMKSHFVEHSQWRAEKARKGEGVFGKSYLRGTNPNGEKPTFPHNHKTRLHLHAPSLDNED